MARALRIEFPGAFYHVMSRGNEKQNIYRDRWDKEKFMGYLKSASDRYGAVIHCYCLLDNHYHLVVETPEGNLSKIMRHINGAYVSYFNAKHERVGHLFQGRYKSILVDADAYILPLSRYIHKNPVRNGLVENPLDYEWSSYRAYLNQHIAQKWLQVEFMLSLLNDGRDARKSYQRYVEDTSVEINELQGAKLESLTLLGRGEFLEEIREKHLSVNKYCRDLPATKKLKESPVINEIVTVVGAQMNADVKLMKKMSIYLCHHYSGSSLKDIGDYFGIGESAVSESSRRFSGILFKDQRLAETVAGLLAELKI